MCMSSSLYGLSNDTRLSSKAGAMEFAIVMNTTRDNDGRIIVDYEEAKKLYDFICANVSLPDVGRDFTESYADLMQTLVKEMAAASKKKDVVGA